ncbi:Kinase [Gryllus bimaculatus]|nr:Kinase [Gryllus bimaculatus]
MRSSGGGWGGERREIAVRLRVSRWRSFLRSGRSESVGRGRARAPSHVLPRAAPTTDSGVIEIFGKAFLTSKRTLDTTHDDYKSTQEFLMMNGASSKYFDPGDENQNSIYPPGTVPLEYQVAGHTFGDGKSELGMLKRKDGLVLKPIEKPVYGERELKFYQELQKATDPISVALRSFVPEFHGATVLKMQEKDVRFIVLKDATFGFAEPCIMDIKIGRQTWDPEASLEKMEGERKKYAECKRDLGFCIPGFQVYRIATGKVLKLGKDYGKRLNKNTVKDALRLFLNAEAGLSRELMLQLLACLWRILCWYRSQRRFRFYSSSLLLVYDARKLRQCLRTDLPIRVNHQRPSTLKLSASTGSFNGGPLSPDHLALQGPCFELPSRSSTSSAGSLSPSVPSTPTTPSTYKPASCFGEDSWHVAFEKIRRTHSFINNYEKDLQSVKEDYSSQLDDLISADRPGSRDFWATVKMIDFAHVFPTQNDEPDTNYLDGLENLVNIFESLMEEAV